MTADGTTPEAPNPPDSAGSGGAGGTAPPSAATDAAAPPPAAPRYDVRNLRRSTDDRVIGGVCGGLGRYSGIDPVIFRIAIAALAVFGGIGLLIYALGWLFVPEDRSGVSEVQRLVRGHASPLAVLAAIVVGVLGLFALVDIAHHGGGARIPFLIILAIIAAIIIGRRPGRAGVAAGAYQPVQPAPAYQPAAAYQQAPAYQTQFVAPTNQPPRYQPPAYPPPAASRPMYHMPPQMPLVPPAPPRTPSHLAPLALSFGVVIIGVLFTLDASHAIELSAQTIFAAALLTIGLALVIGAWVGRARSLIFVGLVMAIALAAAAAVDVPLRGGVGNRHAIPTSVSSIPGTYRLGIGKQVVDLSSLNLDGRTVAVTAVVGIGRVWVPVPPNVKVVVRGRAGTGAVALDGNQSSGTRIDRTEVINPVGAALPGEIDLDVRVGIGRVDVFQVPTATTPLPAKPIPPSAPAQP